MSNIPTSPNLNIQLANAVATVAQAQDRLVAASSRADAARREETDAINAVNKEQRHFDELVALVKKSAPLKSDWRQRDINQEPT